MSDKPTYSSTHSHPSHIDLPAPTAPAAGQGPPSAPRPGAPPRGILKNPLRRPSYQQEDGGGVTPATDAERERLGHNLTWDEANIAATDLDKDSLMKIDEPKTPFVKYDAENDLILNDVPELDLRAGRQPNGLHASASPSHSPSGTHSSTGRRSSSASSSRSASFSLPSKSGPVRPGVSSRDSSASSPRGTPTNPTGPSLLGSGSGASSGGGTGSDGLGLSGIDSPGLVPPPQPVGATQVNTAVNAGEVFDDSDEEAMDDETRQRHREFQEKRAGHYGNEAKIAMARARELAARELAEADAEEADGEAGAGARGTGSEVNGV